MRRRRAKHSGGDSPTGWRPPWTQRARPEKVGGWDRSRGGGGPGRQASRSIGGIAGSGRASPTSGPAAGLAGDGRYRGLGLAGRLYRVRRERHGDRRTGSERIAAQARDHRDRAVVDVGDHDVGVAVAVEIRRIDRPAADIRGDRPGHQFLAGEAAGAVVQLHLDPVAQGDRRGARCRVGWYAARENRLSDTS